MRNSVLELGHVANVTIFLKETAASGWGSRSYINIHMYIYTYIYIHIYMNIYVYIKDICILIILCAYVYSHTYMYTCNFCVCIYFISLNIFIRSLFIQYTCTCEIHVFYSGRTYRDVHQFMCTIILLTNDPIQYFILFLFLSLSPLLASFFLSLSQIVCRTPVGSQKPQFSPVATFFVFLEPFFPLLGYSCHYDLLNSNCHLWKCWFVRESLAKHRYLKL